MNKMIFRRTTKQEIPSMNDHFHTILKTTGHGKHKKRPGKGHGKSLNFKRSKEQKRTNLAGKLQ